MEKYKYKTRKKSNIKFKPLSQIFYGTREV